MLQADCCPLKRILHIFAHINFAKHLNILGWVYYLFKISGYFPVEVAAEIVVRRLDEFKVSLEKHVVCVTDGAAVMVQFG